MLSLDIFPLSLFNSFGEEKARGSAFNLTPLARCHGWWSLYTVAVQGAERRGASVRKEKKAKRSSIDRSMALSIEQMPLSEKAFLLSPFVEFSVSFRESREHRLKNPQVKRNR